MKGKNKIISFIFAIAILLTLLIPPVLNAISADGVNESFVSAISIKETITGVAPFDSDNTAGNDSDPTNNIVRSFDNINYTLEYVTELKTHNPITDAYLFVEFVLPYTKEIATFNMQAMAWLEDAVLTEKDGKQILTGKRYLQNNSEGNAIPGEGTLSVGIKVQAAPNQTIIQPTFKLWMEGNNASEAKAITSEAITVSAAPKYNLKIQRNGQIDYRGYFDFENNTYSSEDFENSNLGRLQGYSLLLQVYNDTSSKELKGIELPSGDITFDFELNEYDSDMNSLTSNPNYFPLLWDYSENRSSTRTGFLNRNMVFKGKTTTAYNVWNAPGNNGGGQYSVHNGGTWTIVQDENQKNLYHVTIKNYKFDTTNFSFPTTNLGSDYRTINYTKNIGCFSVGYMQILMQVPREVTQTQSIFLEVDAKNVKINSVSNTEMIQEVSTSDNISRTNIPLYAPGSISKRNFFGHPNQNTLTYLATNWNEPDNNAYQNSNIMIESCLDIDPSMDDTIKSVNILQKFDDEAFDIESSNGHKFYASANSENIKGDLTILYAAKPDKTGWVSDSEMNSAREENLVYFSSIEELKAQGYTCVAYLYEIRNCSLITGSGDSNTIQLGLTVKVKDTSTIGAVYQTTNDVRVWIDNISHSQLTQGTQPTPRFSLYTNYSKVVYDNDGNIVSGNGGGYIYGNSLLVVGYRAKITKTIDTKNPTTGTTKTTFDMDNNERTITYRLQPKIDSVAHVNGTTNLYITDNLPKDLTYIPNSAYYGDIALEPVITTNSDGTSILKWTLENIVLNEAINPIIFNCTIGKAGTNQDVQNNQSIKNIAKITGDGDKRKAASQNGNLSEVSFTVIKLNAISISKSTNTPYISLGQDFNFTLKYANNSENPLYNSKLYDILPYKGDTRGSDFEGFYKINSIIINFASAPKTFADFTANNYIVGYITDKNIPTNDFAAISTINNWVEITNKTVNTNSKTITYTGLPEAVTGLIFNMKLEGLEYVEITLNMSPTGAQEEGDKYFNGFYQYSNGQVEQVHSNHALVQVYGHLDVTKIWQDDNNKYNTRPSNLDVQIYQDNYEYKNITLNSNNAMSNAFYKWTQRVDNVPMYDIQGNPYVYTIEEDTADINSNFYFDAIYDQPNLTVTNIGIWVKNNNYPEYMIIINKDIINKNNQPATVEDFNKIKLNNNQTFPIVLKELNKTIINNGTTLSESYSGYSGNEYHGLVTDTNQLIFRNIPAGKYEISENIIQYFEFIGIEKIENSEHASFAVENGKYYITLSGLHENNEYVEVKITNKIDDFRPYDKSPSKNNLFNIS